MQFTDSHLHLQDYKAKDAQQIIADLRAAGFAKVVCASTSPADWEQTAAFAAAAPDLVVPAFGLHPWYIAAAPADWPQQLAAMNAGLTALKRRHGRGRRRPLPFNAVWPENLTVR